MFAFLRAFAPKKKSSTVTFYMKGGHAIKVPGVKNVTITREASTGGYCGYNLEFVDSQHKPELISFSIPEIVAVICEAD